MRVGRRLRAAADDHEAGSGPSTVVLLHGRGGRLLARAAVGTARGWPATARGLGFSEIAFGAVTVLAVAAGHRL